MSVVQVNVAIPDPERFEGAVNEAEKVGLTVHSAMEVLGVATGSIEEKAERRKRAGTSPWVFPGPGKLGHLMEFKKFLDRVEAGSGVSFTLHDQRRTFITIAESLDVPYYALKGLLNHRANGDVTGGYIVVNAERLRGPVELVAARILELANVKAKPNVRCAFPLLRV